MDPKRHISFCGLLVVLVSLAFFAIAAAAPAHAAKKSTAKKSSQVTSAKKSARPAAVKSSSKKKTKKGSARARRGGKSYGPLREVHPDFPLPQVPETSPEALPTSSAPRPLPTPTTQAEVSSAVVEALARGSVSGAILAMRDERDSPKRRYLNRQASRIVAYQLDKSVVSAEAHQFYQNLGISYHNLYLFLKAKGIEQRKFLSEADRFYKKGRKAGTLFHQADCDMLRAALTAAAGKRSKAAKIYAKIKESDMRSDFDSMEYLAAYHAAAGNIDGALAALDAAYKLNPAGTLTWLAVGDDFDTIADDPKFKSLMIAWKAEEASKKLKRTLPKEPKVKAADQGDGTQFRPQKSTKHYELKKASGKKKTKKSTVASQKKSSPKSSVAKKKKTVR